MPDLLTTIIPAAVMLFIGLVLGFLIQGIRTENAKSSKDEQKISTIPDGYHEILGVFQNPETQRMAVRLDGMALPAGRLTGGLQLRMARILDQLSRLIGRRSSDRRRQLAAQLDPVQSLRESGDVAVHDAPVVTTPAKPEVKPPDSFVESLPEQPGLRDSVFGARLNLRKKAAAAAPDENAPVSIAAQIDEILQANLIGSPFEDQVIKLMELPERGLVIQIGVDLHDGVDQIPDALVRAFVKEAVDTWNQQNTITR
jgi:hypothetical protein